VRVGVWEIDLALPPAIESGMLGEQNGAGAGA
jgi:hypothetical protein